MSTPLDTMPDMPSRMGIGSGIDTRKIVQDLVQAERAPTEGRLARREEEIQEQISALGQMRSVISDFRDAAGGLSEPDSYSGIESGSSHSDVVEVSTADEAGPGDYDVHVEQLARSQRLATASGAFEDSADPIGTGRLIFVDGEGREQAVSIGEEQSTLLGIRDAINAQTEGLRASVVDDGDGPRLAIATQATGQANSIEQIRVEQEPGEDGDQGDLSPLQFGVTQEQVDGEGEQSDGEGDVPPAVAGLFEQIQGAADAVVVIDGMRISRAENSIEGAIEGVTLELGQEGESRVSIREQTGLAEENIQRLVETYNQVRGQLNQLSAYDAENEQAAPLQGDSTLRNLVNRFSRAVIDPVSSLRDQPIQSLGDLGVRTNRNGTLELDSGQLQSAVKSHPEAVTRLMTEPEGGVMARLEEIFNDAVGRESVIDMRTEGLESRLGRIASDRESLDSRMERREEQLRDQFSRMNARVAELDKTSEFLEQRLASLNGNKK